MKLKDYLEQAKLTPVEFAEMIGVHFATVYDYMRKAGDLRLNRPRAKTLEAIVEVTDGAVTASDFYDMPRRAKRRRRKQASARA